MNTILAKFPQANEHAEMQGRDITFDFGIALALDEKLEDSKKALQAFLTLSQRKQHYFRLCARAIVASFKAEDHAYLDGISDIEEQGRSLFPFELRAKQ